MSQNRPALLERGHVLGGYRIESVLGEGGFGVTYRATQLSNDAGVALKECCPLEAATREGDMLVAVPGRESEFEDTKRRFYEEAKLLFEMEPHDAVVRVTNLFEKHGTFYFAMDYVEGAMLIEYIRQKVVTDDESLRHSFKRLIGALEHLHEQGILHRDICPRNIMIRHEDGEPVLIDFGAARIVPAGGSSNLTSIGKFNYGAIEQFIPIGKQGPWTDIHALGASFYELTCFRTLPGILQRYTQLIEANVDSRPELDNPTVRVLPPAFTRALEWATRFYPHERPQAAAALREILQGDAIGDIPGDVALSKRWGRAPNLRDKMEDERTRVEIAALKKSAAEECPALPPLQAEGSGPDDPDSTVQVDFENGVPIARRSTTPEVEAPQAEPEVEDQAKASDATETVVPSSIPANEPQKSSSGSNVLRIACIVILSLVAGYLIAFLIGNAGGS